MSRKNLAALVFVSAISLVCWRIASSAPNGTRYDLFRVFVGTLSQVEREYVRDVEREDLFRGGLIGLMESLDGDSSYLSPDVYQRAQAEAFPEGDVGIYVAMLLPHRQLFILGVAPGSPAEKAGLTPGDWIAEIDDRSTTRLTVEEAAQLLQGAPGTEVNLKLARPFARRGTDDDEGEEEDGAPFGDGSVPMTLKREKPVESPLLGRHPQPEGDWQWWIEGEQGLAYVRMPRLAPGTTEALRTRLGELGGVRGLVLDLRFCTGGTSDEAVSLGDLFVSSGRLLSITGRNLAEQTWDAKAEETLTEPKLTVLVGPYTAGPGEALAAALQDHARAKVVGMKTMGKGGVSRLVHLKDGKSALKLTVGTLVRPNGKSLFRSPRAEDDAAWGVTPDSGLVVLQDSRELFQHLRRTTTSPESKPAKEPSVFVDEGLRKAVEALKAQLAG